MDEILYINFEDERLIGMTSNDLNLILEVHLEMYGKKPILFLDEIQIIEGWEKFARRMADIENRIYITGSNANMLSQEIQTTLGGRFLTIDVYPYSFKEFLTANEIIADKNSLSSTVTKAEILRLFNEYFYFGGLPEVIKYNAKRDYLSGVFQKIYLGDIASRYSVNNIFALRILFKKLAESIKQPISFTRIKNIMSTTGVKVGTQTIINYIEYAKDAWLISSIQNIAGKLAEKESNPKYYFTDNGILNLFLIDGETSLLENLVAITLLRRYGRTDSVYFYNKGVEVDFYIPEDELAIQVSYNLNKSDGTFERETGALVKFSKVFNCRKHLIITRNSEQKLNIENTTIDIVPVWKWVLGLSEELI
ncbi:MAG TPA: ATP-binding protein [Fervidobacterium sp.]|nr:ATP-binding protein [Acetivibrio sp.]HUM43207.1 ATP-binding protein [Fervidobacterium sp.]